MENQSKKKWLHVIGACGKATAPIAAMFKRDLGWFVTGTDLQFLEPASNILTDNEIPFEQSFHFSHLTREFWINKLNNMPDTSDVPDLVLAVETITKDNKEYRFAKLKNIDVRPFSEILKDYFVKEESIVVIGTAGKTTTTAMITYLLKNLELDPTYMIGAEVSDFAESCVYTDSNFSVIEGDEYHSKSISMGAKFLQYKPKYLVITNVGYEHQDVFPTIEEYRAEFKKAVDLVPSDGLIVAHKDNVPDKILKDAKARVIRYSIGPKKEVSMSTEYTGNSYYDEIDKSYILEFFDTNNDKFLISTKNLNIFPSIYNFQNLLATFIVFKEIPIIWNKFREKSIFEPSSGFIGLMEGFKGPKKRLEILYKSENRIVVDDFGIAPERAKNSLNALKSEFKDFEIVAVFEPNSGSRPKSVESLKKMYSGIFDLAKEVIIPDLSEFNTELASGADLVAALKQNNINSSQINAQELSEYLLSKDRSEKLLIVFFSSYRLTVEAEKFVKTLSV